MNTLDIPGIFKSDADIILKCREDAIRIHGTNIRAAGDEVEICVRDYLIRMLPPRYYVSQGHLIDRIGNVSAQMDIIISDNSNLPSLQTTKDGTRYIPIDSVYSVGEIKSTYYKSKKPIQGFSDSIKDIRENLLHTEILNTAYEGVIKDDTLLRDMALSKANRVLNRIFFFAIFVDGGDFEFDDVAPYYSSHDLKYLPNIVVILNKGLIIRAALLDNRFSFNRYPEDVKEQEDWYFCPFPGKERGSLEGNHLGILYYMLVEHLANSYLEPPSLKDYLQKLMIGRKSLLKKASAT